MSMQKMNEFSLINFWFIHIFIHYVHRVILKKLLKALEQPIACLLE